MLTAEKKPSMRLQDMTEGSILPLILSFALPLFIGNVFQQVYTMVDTMVVGHHLGASGIAAIGATASLYSLIISFASGMNSGFGIVVTRCFGARGEKELKAAIAGMLVLNLVITAVLTVLALAFLRPLLSFINTPTGVFADAYTYIFIICAGMAATNAYNMFASILRALGNSRSPLYFLMLSCAINVFLDILFVAVLDAGVAGAAAATVTAQGVAAVTCGVYLLRCYRELLPQRADFHIRKSMAYDLIGMGSAMALMLCVVDLGTVIFSRANNLLGEEMISAHTAARRLYNVMAMPISAIGAANSTFVGQNWGAGKKERIRSAIKSVITLELIWSVAALLFVLLFGNGLVRLTTGITDESIISNGALSLTFHTAFFPALSVLLCLRSSMQAMGHKLAPVISSCIELALKLAAAQWLLPRLGFLGSCMTEPFTWVAMMVFLVAAYTAMRRKLYET